MTELDAAAERCYQYLESISYLRCVRVCSMCEAEENVLHPVSERTRRRLARDMARAALGK